MECQTKTSAPSCYANKKNLDLINKLKGKHFSTCANCVKKLNGSEASFLFRSFSDLVNQRNPLQLSPNQRKTLQKKIAPYGDVIKPFISPKTNNSQRMRLMRRKLKFQTGDGVISLVVAAVVPLIADLITKAIKRK